MREVVERINGIAPTPQHSGKWKACSGTVRGIDFLIRNILSPMPAAKPLCQRLSSGNAAFPDDLLPFGPVGGHDRHEL